MTGPAPDTEWLEKRWCCYCLASASTTPWFCDVQLEGVLAEYFDLVANCLMVQGQCIRASHVGH